MLPVRALGVVGGKGRFREDSEPSAQPECLINMKVSEVTAPCLVPQLQGEQPAQRRGGRDHTRAGRIRLGSEVVAADTRPKGEAEEKTGDPRAPAAPGGQRDVMHVSHERRGRTDDGRHLGADREGGHEGREGKGAPRSSPPLRAQVPDQATQGGRRIAQTFGDLHLGLVCNTHSPSGCITAVEGLR